ncbi:PREDICTED: G1/S-specific cyclin-D2-like, partial [Rhagoletis zephyria]|uniref:G1/S-specific cyclin-D2-like n=1 Tax=Rhagoletis zephyria TaxID=28612 RepID=UPI0008113757
MELLCIEREFEPTASLDGAILDDDRLLHNLILTEERYLITGSYFKCLQTDLKPSMREVVANWMLEVCEEERCQREVYPLAMNLLDRFLAVVRISKTQLQLLGSVCLFIASKMRQSRPLSPKALVQYTDWSITLEELTGWEMLVLSRLKWDVASVPPNDFVGPLLRRLAKKFKLIGEHYVRIKKHTLNMIDLCSA